MYESQRTARGWQGSRLYPPRAVPAPVLASPEDGTGATPGPAQEPATGRRQVDAGAPVVASKDLPAASLPGVFSLPGVEGHEEGRECIEDVLLLGSDLLDRHSSVTSSANFQSVEQSAYGSPAESPIVRDGYVAPQSLTVRDGNQSPPAHDRSDPVSSSSGSAVTTSSAATTEQSAQEAPADEQPQDWRCWSAEVESDAPPGPSASADSPRPPTAVGRRSAVRPTTDGGRLHESVVPRTDDDPRYDRFVESLTSAVDAMGIGGATESQLREVFLKHVGASGGGGGSAGAGQEVEMRISAKIEEAVAEVVGRLLDEQELEQPEHSHQPGQGADVLEGDPAELKPWQTWEECRKGGMPPDVVNVLMEYGPSPTTVQKYAWPVLLQKKRDLIVDGVALAQSGSGRGLAYLVPALISAMVAEV